MVARHDDEEIVAGNRAFMLERGIPAQAMGPAPDDRATEVLVARAGTLLGAIRIADTLRPESQAAVAALRAMGIRTLLLTGDQRGVAAHVGEALGVDQVLAELLPEHKVAEVERLGR